jgi:hypothetical protein
MRATPSLRVAAPVIAGLSVVGAVVSILARWPHQFGGHGDRHHMLADFASSGTALAPPLAFLILLAGSSLLIRRRDRWGSIACVVLIALSAFMVVGSLGEALAGRTADVPRGVQLFSGAWGIVAGGLLAVLCIRSIVTDRRDRRTRDGDHDATKSPSSPTAA